MEQLPDLGEGGDGIAEGIVAGNAAELGTCRQPDAAALDLDRPTRPDKALQQPTVEPGVHSELIGRPVTPPSQNYPTRRPDPSTSTHPAGARKIEASSDTLRA